MIYGSHARGDAITGSDLDVLALAENPLPSLNSGEVNVSFYTLDLLSTGISSLFGAHLKRDGRIIWDSRGDLARALAAIGDVDTERVLARSWNMARLFTAPDRDLPKYLPGLLRQARYLLRSCMYAQAIAEGAPCFSVRELAERHADPALASVLASRQNSEPTLADLRNCLSRLQQLVGDFPTNEHGSLEATVVNEWGHQGDILSMAFMALGTAGNGSDYAEVQKILL